MNKFVISAVIANCIAFSAVAMDGVLVTPEQNAAFARHLCMAVGFCKNMIQSGELSDKNSIFFVLGKMSGELSECKGDVNTMIHKVGLVDHINIYKQLDSHPLLQFGLAQVRSKSGDVNGAIDYVRKTRNLLSGLLLQENQPSYSPSFIGEVQTKDRIEFMKRNETFSLEDIAVKAYTALFVYQLIFASQVE